MAGVTDLPFRRLVAGLGAGLVVSEMVSARPDLRQTRKSRLRLAHADEISPRSVQIAGPDAAMLADAARYAVSEGAQIVDINMGCPAKKVCRRAAGSALLRDERLAADILQAVVAAVDVPVTLKMRTGWSPEERNVTRIARIAEDAGIAALAIHGRTRACRFRGVAEYDSIAAAVACVSIPVFANGDVTSPQAALRVLAHTGAAGVMIGRGAQGRPWLPGLVAAAIDSRPWAEPDAATRAAIVGAHVSDLHTFYGPVAGVRIARKHGGWYLRDAGAPPAVRNAFNHAESPAEQLDVLAAGLQDSGAHCPVRAARPAPAEPRCGLPSRFTTTTPTRHAS